MVIENGPYTVYILTNKINNRMYIGTTRKKLYQRFNKGEGYRHQKLFYEDIKKYGWDNFEADVFAANLTEEEAFNTEKMLIKMYRENFPDMLYNRDAGGKHGEHCQETKEIIRDLNVGRIISEETKEKIREARAKQVISYESIMKAAAKNRGRKMSPEFCKKLGERSSKKIICIETGIVYSSATKASKQLGISTSMLSQVCNKKYETAKGLHFEFV